MKFIAYNNSDIYGSDGLWAEAETSEAAQQKADKMLVDCGFGDDSADVTIVNLAEIAEMDQSDLVDLITQWGMSHSNGWTSDEVDTAISAEFGRRGGELSIGRTAEKLLCK